MSTAYDVQDPEDMMRASHHDMAERWPESTIHAVAESLERYGREKPLAFAAWAFGIGFVLGWKLKFW